MQSKEEEGESMEPKNLDVVSFFNSFVLIALCLLVVCCFNFLRVEERFPIMFCLEFHF